MECGIVYHIFKNVTYIFLWFRVKDKLAWLSLCERKTCEECSRDCSFCRAGNRRHRESRRKRERFRLVFHISICNFTCCRKRNFWLKEIYSALSPRDENIHGPMSIVWFLEFERTNSQRLRATVSRLSKPPHLHLFSGLRPTEINDRLSIFFVEECLSDEPRFLQRQILGFILHTSSNSRCKL